ncbi:hypothetical protein Q4595_08460 [Wenyingzhuangia sp. 1_MG-2023]|nr:hypothetical protein [Wenyingzhuangia sp. 1_MG-2023]
MSLGVMKFNALEGQCFRSNRYAYGIINIVKKENKFKAGVKVLHSKLKLSKLELKGANAIRYKKGNVIKVVNK